MSKNKKLNAVKNGKGDRPRKVKISKFDENWEKINWRSKKKEKA